MELNSRLFKCRLYHKRHHPKKHSFSYSHLMFLLDLDELDRLDSELKLFGHKNFSIYQFRDIDHLEEDETPLKERVLKLFNRGDHGSQPEKIYLLANPRVFGYVFNPISVYYFYDRLHNYMGAIVEICNTFMERKAFVFKTGVEKDTLKIDVTKNFYISPYCKVDDRLHFSLSDPLKGLSLKVDTRREDFLIVETGMTGHPVAISDAVLFKALFHFPFLNLMTISRIHIQAFKLWLKGVPHELKEDNPHLQTDLYRPDRSIRPGILNPPKNRLESTSDTSS